MKKNRCLKIASGLLLLVLVTTCAIGTTLAKYTTAGDAQDSARVAKWGVKLEMEGDSMFSNEYEGTGGAITVKGESGTVVAPGTASDSTTAARFSISGTPEVAVEIVIELTINNDIFLKAGTYSDPTAAATSTFTLTNDYYPVVFTLKQIATAEGNPTPDYSVSGNLATIQTALAGYSGKTYKPNTDLAATFELSWAWAFDDGNDKADTYLGNLMAGENPDILTEGTDYSTQVSYTLSITVTQVD